jgi:hypothetical protein
MEVKIKLKVKEVEIELTMREAKELTKILGDITGEPRIIEREVIRNVPTYIPSYPYPWWYYEPWKITWTCGTGQHCLPISTNYSSISDNVSIGYTVE